MGETISAYVNLGDDKNMDTFVDSSLKVKDFIGKEMTGFEFNKLFSNSEFVKLTCEPENHNDHDYEFHDGLIDIYSQDGFYNNLTTRDYFHRGFYFTTKNNMYKWVCEGDYVMAYTRNVTIPNDATIYIEDYDKFRVDRFSLSPREEIDLSVYANFVKYYENDSNYMMHIIRVFEFVNDRNYYLRCIGCHPNQNSFVNIHEVDKLLCLKAVELQLLGYVPPFFKSL